MSYNGKKAIAKIKLKRILKAPEEEFYVALSQQAKAPSAVGIDTISKKRSVIVYKGLPATYKRTGHDLLLGRRFTVPKRIQSDHEIALSQTRRVPQSRLSASLLERGSA